MRAEHQIIDIIVDGVCAACNAHTHVEASYVVEALTQIKYRRCVNMRLTLFQCETFRPKLQAICVQNDKSASSMMKSNETPAGNMQQ